MLKGSKKKQTCQDPLSLTWIDKKVFWLVFLWFRVHNPRFLKWKCKKRRPCVVHLPHTHTQRHILLCLPHHHHSGCSQDIWWKLPNCSSMDWFNQQSCRHTRTFFWLFARLLFQCVYTKQNANSLGINILQTHHESDSHSHNGLLKSFPENNFLIGQVSSSRKLVYP